MTDGGQERVGIAVTTYLRPNLLAILLQSLAAQNPSGDGDLELAVFDNDAKASAQQIVDEYRNLFPYPVHYQIVPQRGFSMVRNAVLEFARDRYEILLMIDDDEFACNAWLSEMLLVARETNADAVIGPVPSILPDGTKKWVQEGGFFQLPIKADRASLTDGYSGNCLLKLATLKRLGLQFNHRLNKSGGEDQLFFRQLHAYGGRIIYAVRAVAYERVTETRVCASYILRRNLRKGNTLSICDRIIHGTAGALAVRTGKAVGLVVLGTMALLPQCIRGRKGVMLALCDIARGTGMMIGLVGIIVTEGGAP